VVTSNSEPWHRRMIVVPGEQSPDSGHELPAHVAGYLPVDDEGGPRVDPEQGIEFVQAGLGYRGRGDPAAGGMNDDVDVAERCDRLGEEPSRGEALGCSPGGRANRSAPAS
jgi:hypothetical protein